MLRWSRKDLAERAGISVGTVEKIEAGEGYALVSAEIHLKLNRAFNDVGMTFWYDPAQNAHSLRYIQNHTA